MLRTVTFSFLIKLIKREITITPPVIIGYCTDAGRCLSEISVNKFPNPQKIPYAAESINALLLIFKVLCPDKIHITNDIITAVSLLRAIKSTLPTAFRFD